MVATRKSGRRLRPRQVLIQAVALCAIFLSLLSQGVSPAAAGRRRQQARARAQGGARPKACRAYSVPKKSHRAPIGSLRIKEGFDVVDVALLANITHRDVANLEVTLSSYTTHTPNAKEDAREASRRQVVLKPFGGGEGAQQQQQQQRQRRGNFTSTVWADFGKELDVYHDEAPYTGVWRPAEPLKAFVRGWGKRASVGGSKGVWTLEVDSRDGASGGAVHMFSRDLPVLEGWAIFLCGRGQSLMNTPEVSALLPTNGHAFSTAMAAAEDEEGGLRRWGAGEGTNEGDYVVRAFSGRSPAAPAVVTQQQQQQQEAEAASSTRAWRPFSSFGGGGLFGGSFGSLLRGGAGAGSREAALRRVGRTAAAWVGGLWAWKVLSSSSSHSHSRARAALAPHHTPSIKSPGAVVGRGQPAHLEALHVAGLAEAEYDKTIIEHFEAEAFHG